MREAHLLHLCTGGVEKQGAQARGAAQLIATGLGFHPPESCGRVAGIVEKEQPLAQRRLSQVTVPRGRSRSSRGHDAERVRRIQTPAWRRSSCHAASRFSSSRERRSRSFPPILATSLRRTGSQEPSTDRRRTPWCHVLARRVPDPTHDHASHPNACRACPAAGRPRCHARARRVSPWSRRPSRVLPTRPPPPLGGWQPGACRHPSG